MKNKIFVDTLFIVAVINKQDQYHQKALELGRNFDNFYLVTSDAILLEVGNALSSKYKNEAVAIIDTFLDSEEIEVIRLNPNLFAEALNLYRQYQDKSWGLVDCISFVIMKQLKINQALTFDKHFIQAGFQALMR